MTVGNRSRGPEGVMPPCHTWRDECFGTEDGVIWSGAALRRRAPATLVLTDRAGPTSGRCGHDLPQFTTKRIGTHFALSHSRASRTTRQNRCAAGRSASKPFEPERDESGGMLDHDVLDCR